MKRKVVLYFAMSLDGYIAKEDGNVDFLSLVETPTKILAVPISFKM